MISEILNITKNCSLSQTTGRFVSDKSYAYDAIYFMSKFILETANAENIYDKTLQLQRSLEYTKDIFQLRDLASGAPNYMTETLNLLCFAGVISKQDQHNYKIVNRAILEYISEKIENAYIFVYLIVYQTFKNDGISNLYADFVHAPTKEIKEQIVEAILEVFREKSISIIEPGSNWEKQLVKYALVILGFANDAALISRTLRVQMHEGNIKNVSIEDVSINIEGTRTGANSKKINDYIKTFAKGYVQKELQSFLFAPVVISGDVSNNNEHVAEDLASLKIEKIIKEADETEYLSKYKQDQFIERKVKARNQNIQRAFKNSLLNNNVHRCPICGFEYTDFLIASHIKPYSQCDDTYDAINNYNGLLMCPNHDKLFEGAKLMTIDAKTGVIILSDKVRNSPDFGHLHNKTIDKSLIECERRHYLAWHNAEFAKQNS